MAFLQYVIKYSTLIEQHLEDIGGSGRGIYNLSASVKPKLGNTLFEKINQIAKVRNSLVHDHDYRFEGSEIDFINSCKQIVAELELLSQPNKKNTHSPSTNINNKGITNGGNMSTTPKWVEIKSEDFWHRYWKSTENDRLVFFEGYDAIVKPIGKHRTPLFSKGRINKIGFVKMTPEHLNINHDATTSDGIKVNVELKLTIKIKDNQEAISRVASDVLRGSESQQQISINCALKALRKVIGETLYSDVKNTASIENDILTQTKLILETQAESSFDIIEIITEIGVYDSDLQSHEANLIKNRLKLKEMESAQAIIDFENKRRQLDMELERAHIKAKELDNIDVEKQRIELERIIKQEEAELQIKLKELELRKETLRMDAQDKRDYLKALAAGARTREQINMIQQFAKRFLSIDMGPQNDNRDESPVFDNESVKKNAKSSSNTTDVDNSPEDKEENND